MIQFVGVLFGEDISQELPHPGTDMDDFIGSLKSLLATTEPQFNVITKKVEPLIDVDQLRYILRRQMGEVTSSWCVIS